MYSVGWFCHERSSPNMTPLLNIPQSDDNSHQTDDYWYCNRSKHCPNYCCGLTMWIWWHFYCKTVEQQQSNSDTQSLYYHHRRCLGHLRRCYHRQCHRHLHCQRRRLYCHRLIVVYIVIAIVIHIVIIIILVRDTAVLELRTILN